jgi:predicted acetyltransferase
VPYRVRPVRNLTEYDKALDGIGHYFGWSPSEEEAERFSRLLPFDRMLAAFDGPTIVGGAGSIPFSLTIPGGPVPCAGVTVVGVLPSHRRKGLLRRMMETQLRDIRERGEPIAALWASEEGIYRRFGYGLATISLILDIDQQAVSIRSDLPPEGSLRFVGVAEAARAFSKVYDKVARVNVGFTGRSQEWWELRRLRDTPEFRRGAGPLQCVLFERDGRPAGYVLYRIAQEGASPDDWKKTVKVAEIVGIDDRAARELWRFLLEIDWVDRISMMDLAIDDPLLLHVDRMNKLGTKLYDGLWLRVIDVPAALAARSYATEGRVTLEVTHDPTFPDNVGTWTIAGGKVRRTTRRPDVHLDVQALGSVMLGGFSFAQLARGELLAEGARGGLARADALFRVDRAPFCPEVF